MLSPTPQAPHLYRTGWVRHLFRYKKKHVQAGPLETGVRAHRRTPPPAQATQGGHLPSTEHARSRNGLGKGRHILVKLPGSRCYCVRW